MSLGVGSLLIGELPQSSYVAQGQSAYEVAVKNGFVGTEQQWLQSLVGSSQLVSSVTPPDWPENGLLWWNTVDTLSIYLSGMWMPISLKNAVDEALVNYGTSAPDPADNKIWLNTELGRIFHYYNGTWVEFAQPGIISEVAIGGAGAAPEIEDIPSLRSELDGKQPAGAYAALIHTHEISDVNNLQILLSSKSDAIHTHAISDVHELQTELSSRAPLVHKHEISDVTGLQSAIDSKAELSHSHGQIGPNGNIGISSGRPIITGPNGVLQAGTFGNSAGTVCQGNDERLSDARVPLAHNHDAAEITTGTLANGRLPARLQAAAQPITNWNNALENGWYWGHQAANAPEGVLDYWLGYVEVHNPVWVTQTVHRFTADAPTNTHIWRRSSSDLGGGVIAWGAWYKLQLSQAEQDARYLPKFDSVQQGGGAGQSNNKIYIGWSGSQLRLQVDNTDFGANWPITVPGAGVPAGAIMPFAANVVPSGWLAANGAAVLRSTYAGLFASIGTTYGAGDGSTTFNIPDLRGYFVRGAGTNSNGVASAAFGVRQASALGSHNHGFNDYYQRSSLNSSARCDLRNGGSNCAAQGWPSITESGATTPNSTFASGDTETRPHNIAMLYCIKF